MKRTSCLLLFIALSAIQTSAGIYAAVGTGSNQATVVINFGDGACYQFDTAFTPATITGLELMDVIEAETTLTTVRLDFGFGSFIDGISYDGHSDNGYGGGEDFWHYWIRDNASEPWLSAPIGAADRVAADATWDGWVYGSAAAPTVVPEPTSILLAGMGTLFLIRRWRKSARA